MKILIFFTLCTFFIGCQTGSYYDLIQSDWENFKKTYNKHYATETEERFRMKIFAENKHEIDLHNQKFAQGLVKFENGINEYSDLLQLEFRDIMSCYKIPKNSNKTIGAYLAPRDMVVLPDKWDWRDEGAVGPVKRQYGCGACYAFSSTGALEGQHFRKTGKLVSLSEQNLIDCSKKYGNNGCNGGDEISSFEYILANGGIDTEESYPYEARDRRKCRYKSENCGATVSGFEQIYPGDEDQLQLAVATIGPMASGMDASHRSFTNFKGEGVYYEPKCGNTDEDIDHAVLVIGYGTTEDGQDYWLVKNSYGTRWGDNGFFKIARNKDNHCGISNMINYPLV